MRSAILFTVVGLLAATANAGPIRRHDASGSETSTVADAPKTRKCGGKHNHMSTPSPSTDSSTSPQTSGADQTSAVSPASTPVSTPASAPPTSSSVEADTSSPSAPDSSPSVTLSSQGILQASIPASSSAAPAEQTQPPSNNGGDLCQDPSATSYYRPVNSKPLYITTEPTAQDTDGSSELAQWLLKQHNIVRNEFQAPPLVWDASIAKEWQGYTTQCDWTHHGPSNLYAAMMSGTDVISYDLDAAVNGWADESKLWHGGNDYVEGAGHFTQVVWKNATKVGCSWHLCPKGTSVFPNDDHQVYLACGYDMGNMQGEFNDNVGSFKQCTV